MNSKKCIVVIIFLVLTILLSYFMPAAKYTGTGIIAKLNIPTTTPNWIGKDITEESGINEDLKNYNHLSEAVAYQYINKQGKVLHFIVLDAQTFHNPKVCFTGAGYTIEDLSDTEFHLPTHTLNTHTVFTEKRGKNSLSFYWVIIDKKIAHELLEQKYKQFLSAVFGQTKVGLMVRLDVPATKDNIDDAMLTARQFIQELSSTFPKDQKEYIFGTQ